MVGSFSLLSLMLTGNDGFCFDDCFFLVDTGKKKGNIGNILLSKGKYCKQLPSEYCGTKLTEGTPSSWKAKVWCLQGAPLTPPEQLHIRVQWCNFDGDHWCIKIDKWCHSTFPEMLALYFLTNCWLQLEWGLGWLWAVSSNCFSKYSSRVIER